MGRIVILSDIHGNLAALNQVFESIAYIKIDSFLLLGDLIDYGPESNAVIERIQEMEQKKIMINIWGNHEQAIIQNVYERFSSERGKSCAQYTKSTLTEKSLKYIYNMDRQGWREFQIQDKKCLAVHGSLEDVFWKSITPQNMTQAYAKYDYVFSGHSHIPMLYEKFYDCDCAEKRYKKRTVFLNPGSVGQPRNHDPNANFAILNTETGAVEMQAVVYDFKVEMELFSNEVDCFYRERLAKGI